MEWLKKIAGYAPDIVGAIVSGGATLPATALRVISKELTGVETDNAELVEKAVNNASPDELLKLKEANNAFLIRKMDLQYQELANQRVDTQSARKEHKGHWMTFLLPLLLLGLAGWLSYELLNSSMPESNRDVLVFIVGQVFGYLGAGITYWLGSSRGSAEKNTQLNK